MFYMLFNGILCLLTARVGIMRAADSKRTQRNSASIRSF
jgi:hypothetical protein